MRRNLLAPQIEVASSALPRRVELLAVDASDAADDDDVDAPFASADFAAPAFELSALAKLALVARRALCADV